MTGTNLPPLDAKRSESRSRRFWVVLILAFFGLDISIAIIAISMAAGDPSFRSIPGFGARAVAWDERRALKENLQNRRWKLDVQRSFPDADAIEIQIVSEANEPITGCSGTVCVFHFTRVALQTRAELKEVEPGRYTAAVNVSKPGMWNVELDLIAPDQQRCWYENAFDWSPSVAVPIRAPVQGSLR
jgi:nitrogen fixation protein FixH